MPEDPRDDPVRSERERVGRTVRSLRDWRDLRQEGLDHLAGISDRNLRRMESGATSVGIDQYIKAAGALKVPLFWLFADDWPRLAEELEQLAGGGAGGGEPPDPPATERHR